MATRQDLVAFSKIKARAICGGIRIAEVRMAREILGQLLLASRDLRPDATAADVYESLNNTPANSAGG